MGGSGMDTPAESAHDALGAWEQLWAIQLVEDFGKNLSHSEQEMAHDIQHQAQSLIKGLDFTLSTSTRMAREGLEVLKRVERNLGALQLSEYSREEALESFSEISQILEALKTRHDSIEEKYTKMKQKLSKSIDDFSKFRKLCEAADPMGMRKQSDEHIRHSKVYDIIRDGGIWAILLSVLFVSVAPVGVACFVAVGSVSVAFAEHSRRTNMAKAEGKEISAMDYENALAQAEKMTAASECAQHVAAGMANFWIQMSCTLESILSYTKNTLERGSGSRGVFQINRLDADNFRQSCTEMSENLKVLVECAEQSGF